MISWFARNSVAANLLMISIIIGGLVALLLAAPLPLWSFMTLMALAYAAFTPVGAIATTLLYGDAVAAATGADTHADAAVSA